jgi:hypothetical protein
VRELENGDLPISASLMVVLADLLGEVRGHPVALADLTVGSESIQISAGTSVEGPALHSFYEGVPVELEQLSATAQVSAIFDSFTDEISHPWPPGTKMGTIRAQRHDVSLAEQRASKALRISAVGAATWARHLWGQSLDDERDRRAGASATAQAKGRTTRDLIQELRAAIEGAADRG